MANVRWQWVRSYLLRSKSLNNKFYEKTIQIKFKKKQKFKNENNAMKRIKLTKTKEINISIIYPIHLLT